MGKVTQLAYSGIAPGSTTTNLMAAAVAAAGASQAGDMMQDLKTAHILRVSPRPSFFAQCIGIPAGIAVCVPIYKLFDSAYQFGSTEIPAPAAMAWKAVAEVLADGLSTIDVVTPKAHFGALAGALFGILLPILRRVLKDTRVRPFIPSGSAFGLAFIIFPYQSFTIFLGGVTHLIWSKVRPKSCEESSFSFASGLIAGAGLFGVFNAILKLSGVKPLFPLDG
jgi:uncharacterized oligopeptide transporter (OPT) family protein